MTSTSEIRRVFIDTSAWISLMNKNEFNHEQAVAFHKSLPTTIYRITTWGIVSETFTWTRYHIGSRAGLQWLSLKEALERQGLLQIVFPDPQMEIGVKKIIERFHDQKLSYVDAYSIALIKSRPDIDVIFAFDRHMALAGIPVLPGTLK